MRKLAFVVLAVFPLSLAGSISATAATTAGKSHRGERMSQCANGWDVYKSQNGVQGKGSGKAHKQYMRDCLSGKITPPAPGPAPTPPGPSPTPAPQQQRH